MDIENITQAIFEEVEYKKLKYQCKYAEKPKYIKIPIGYYNILYLPYKLHGLEKIYTFCGLQLCPTRSIETIDEIEVF